MKIEAINIAGGSPLALPKAADKVDDLRKKKDDLAQGPQVDKNQVAPEELLQQIKGLTEDGLFSVRFENDDRSDVLVVKIVDRETDETIRQVPAEELLDLKSSLERLRGNIVDTKS